MENLKKFSIDYLIFLLKQIIEFNEIELDIPVRIIELDARTAYRFALCTETFYKNEEYSGVLKDVFHSFNMRNLDLYGGIYTFKDDYLHDLKNQRIPDIFSGKKRIIIKEGKISDEIVSEVYNELSDLKEDISSYLVTCVDPNGSQWEQFYEFYLSEYFIAKNQITDVQIPWPYGGTPDFSCYQHPIARSIGGFLMPEVCNLRYFLNQEIAQAIPDDVFYEEIKIVEVKSSQKTSQAEKYLDKKITNSVYEFFPDGEKNNPPLGLLFLEDSKLKEISHNTEENFFNREDQKWFNHYLKINLLGNLEVNEIANLINVEKITKTELINSLDEITFSEILGAIQSGK